MRHSPARTRRLTLAWLAGALLVAVMLARPLWRFVALGTETAGSITLAAERPVPPTQPISVIPTPTAAGMMPTPSSPDGLTRVVDVHRDTVAPAPDLPYAIQSTIQQTENQYRSLISIVQLSTGTVVRLGDDSGSARISMETPDRVLWTFGCDPCSSFKPGLYLYDVATGTNALVTTNNSYGVSAQMDGDWVLFPQVTSAYSTRNNPVAILRAHNLKTGDEFALTESLYFPLVDKGTYAVGDGIAVWLERGGEYPSMLMMHDFGNDKTAAVPLKGWVGEVVSLGVDDGIITWWGDGQWQGFDQSSGSHFVLSSGQRFAAYPPYPYLPGFSPVQVTKDRIEWCEYRPNGEWERFVGAIDRTP